MSVDIVRVAEKVKAFRADYPPTVAGILTSFTEDEVGGVARVVGCCRIVLLDTGQVMAEAYGTRALRAPLPGKQGNMDTRDPDRAMTQATGRALGLLGYADGESLEGDTDEPDSSGVEHSPQPKVPEFECREGCGMVAPAGEIKQHMLSEHGWFLHADGKVRPDREEPTNAIEEPGGVVASAVAADSPPTTESAHEADSVDTPVVNRQGSRSRTKAPAAEVDGLGVVQAVFPGAESA